MGENMHKMQEFGEMILVVQVVLVYGRAYRENILGIRLPGKIIMKGYCFLLIAETLHQLIRAS